MNIEKTNNVFYVAVARDGTEFFSDEKIQKVEDYINDNHISKKKYNLFINQWNEGIYGDYYSFIEFSDSGIFYGEDLCNDWLIELPKGTIESATGTNLTYKDGCKKIQFEKIEPTGIKWNFC